MVLKQLDIQMQKKKVNLDTALILLQKWTENGS